eukprot:gene8439-265_t
MSWFTFDSFSNKLTELSGQVGSLVTTIEEKANEFISQEEIPQKPTEIYWETPPENWKQTPEKLKEEILKISKNEKNFKIPPTEDFYFVFEENINQAQLMIKLDKNIKSHLFELVPSFLSEDDFWRNYFYRINLVLQNSEIKILQYQIDSLNGDIKQDHLDYESVNKEISEMKTTISLFQSILNESITQFEENKNDSKIDIGFLNKTYDKIIEDKKKMGEWLVEVEDESILTTISEYNNNIQLLIKKFDEFNESISKNVNKQEKVEKPVLHEEISKKDEKKDVDSDEEFDNFLKKPDDYRATKQDEEENDDVNLEEETKLPWEEEDEE